jgi:hypothetical protein
MTGRDSQHAIDANGFLFLDAEITSGTGARVAMHRRGGSAPEQVVRVRAFIDTGADRSVLDPRALWRLGELPTSCIVALRRIGSSQEAERDVPAVEIALRLPDGGVFKSVETPVDDLSHVGAELLLGMDVLSHCLLTLDGPARSFLLRAVSPPDLIRADRTGAVASEQAERMLRGAP